MIPPCGEDLPTGGRQAEPPLLCRHVLHGHVQSLTTKPGQLRPHPCQQVRPADAVGKGRMIVAARDQPGP